MFTVNENNIYAAGNLTILLYMVSLTFYFFGIAFPEFTKAGVVLGTLFFIVSSIIIGVMVKKRIGS